MKRLRTVSERYVVDLERSDPRSTGSPPAFQVCAVEEDGKVSFEVSLYDAHSSTPTCPVAATRAQLEGIVAAVSGVLAFGASKPLPLPEMPRPKRRAKK